MQSLSFPQTSRVARTWPDLPQARVDISSVERATMNLKRGEGIADELDLVEMRYQEGLALANLEAVFAEGLFAQE